MCGPFRFNPKEADMRLASTILVACLIIVAARAFTVALVATVALSMVWGALFRPRQTWPLIAMCLLAKAFGTHPILAGAGIAAVVAMLCIVSAQPIDTQSDSA